MKEGFNIFILRVVRDWAYECIPKRNSLFNYDDDVKLLTTAKRLPESWKMHNHYFENFVNASSKKQKNIKFNDFTQAFDGVSPIVSNKTKTTFERITNDIEFRFVGIFKGVEYYIMNVLRTVDCLDRYHTNAIFNPANKNEMLAVWKYALSIKIIFDDIVTFRLPDGLATDIFVSWRFVQAVIDFKLTGISFENLDDFGFYKINHAVPDLPVNNII